MFREVTVATAVLMLAFAVGAAVSAVATVMLRRPVGAVRRRERIINYRAWAAGMSCFAATLALDGIGLVEDRPLLGMLGSGFMVVALWAMTRAAPSRK